MQTEEFNTLIKQRKEKLKSGTIDWTLRSYRNRNFIRFYTLLAVGIAGIVALTTHNLEASTPPLCFFLFLAYIVFQGEINTNRLAAKLLDRPIRLTEDIRFFGRVLRTGEDSKAYKLEKGGTLTLLDHNAPQGYAIIEYLSPSGQCSLFEKEARATGSVYLPWSNKVLDELQKLSIFEKLDLRNEAHKRAIDKQYRLTNQKSNAVPESLSSTEGLPTTITTQQ
jgi:hypothetical protein